MNLIGVHHKNHASWLGKLTMFFLWWTPTESITKTGKLTWEAHHVIFLWWTPAGSITKKHASWLGKLTMLYFCDEHQPGPSQNQEPSYPQSLSRVVFVIDFFSVHHKNINFLFVKPTTSMFCDATRWTSSRSPESFFGTSHNLISFCDGSGRILFGLMEIPGT